jgi:inorganic pyrophosphatase
MLLSTKVLIPKGAFYEDTTLPAHYGIATNSPELTVLVYTNHKFEGGQTVKVYVLGYIQVIEEGILQYFVYGIPIDEVFSNRNTEGYEEQTKKFLNHYFEITGWGNAIAADSLLERLAAYREIAQSKTENPQKDTGN